ncbi:MAG: hypothetical protein HYW06_03180 [Gemmatimonadetes bacterium]|nr:hypothetical protein [Gemmatimonadota bacterium]
MSARHELHASPETVHWGFFDSSLAPVLSVAPGERVTVHCVSGSPEVVPGPPFELPPELRAIHAACQKPAHESYNRANERQVEEFLTRPLADLPGRSYQIIRDGRFQRGESARQAWSAARARSDAPCVVIERQRLSTWALRTTRWNYLFTVPGESDDRVILVAHYDTWRGPGADDNTTGEEIVKQYLLADLRSANGPASPTPTFWPAPKSAGSSASCPRSCWRSASRPPTSPLPSKTGSMRRPPSRWRRWPAIALAFRAPASM